MERKPKPPTAKGPAECSPVTSGWTASSSQTTSRRSTSPPCTSTIYPGARTAWHSHDGGQHLYVTEGEGRLQTRGEPIVTVRVSDVLWTPSGEEHWHGAAPDHLMTHLSMTTGAPTWGDHVTDEEYDAP